MGFILGFVFSILIAKLSYNALYVSKNNYWGKLEIQNFMDYEYSVFEAHKEVVIWDKKFEWKILLEIEPLIYDPQPTDFQKEFYLSVIDKFDELFVQSKPALHDYFGEVKDSIVNHRTYIIPTVISIPYEKEKEWQICYVTSDNLAFILVYKEYQFIRVKDVDLSEK